MFCTCRNLVLMGTGLALLACVGCASVNPTSDYGNALSLIKTHTGTSEAYDPSLEDEIAGRVNGLLADGLTVEEAVSIALLNNREFQSLFLEIGVSRADVVQSGLLSNPTLVFVPRFPDIGGRSNLTFGLAQEIADLWKIPVRKKIAEAQLERTILKVVNAAINLTAQTKSLY